MSQVDQVLRSSEEGDSSAVLSLLRLDVSLDPSIESQIIFTNALRIGDSDLLLHLASDQRIDVTYCDYYAYSRAVELNNASLIITLLNRDISDSVVDIVWSAILNSRNDRSGLAKAVLLNETFRRILNGRYFSYLAKIGDLEYFVTYYADGDPSVNQNEAIRMAAKRNDTAITTR